MVEHPAEATVEALVEELGDPARPSASPAANLIRNRSRLEPGVPAHPLLLCAKRGSDPGDGSV
jgi:hypothetical protein